MSELQKVHYTTKAHTSGAFVLLSRLLVALFAAMVSLGPPAGVLAQQSAHTGAQAQGAAKASATGDTSIRPFPKINMPQKAIDELRRRVAATQWPDKETVADPSQGVPLATMQKLARYWATDYDWRNAEAKLNALPQFITTIDGLTFTSSTSVPVTRTRFQ